MLVTCKTCNKEFNKIPSEIKKFPNHFCSRSCAAKNNNKGKQRNKATIRICNSCGGEFKREKKHRSDRYCQECTRGYSTIQEFHSEQLKSCTIGEYRNKLSVKNKHPSWTHSHIRQFNRSWNIEMTSRPCAHCGYDKHVELCHAKEISSFDDNALLSEVNSSDNVIQLCRNCHWETHNGFLDIYQLIKERS